MKKQIPISVECGANQTDNRQPLTEKEKLDQLPLSVGETSGNDKATVIWNEIHRFIQIELWLMLQHPRCSGSTIQHVNHILQFFL
jgi:hypothetical protein